MAVDPAESSAVQGLQVQALEVLQRLGYTCLSPAALQQERDSSREVLLVDRLVAALRRLNPGLSEANVHAALRELTGTDAADALPGGRRAHTLLTQGAASPGGGRRARSIRYLDLNEPAGNEYVVTWKLPVRGVKRQLVLDLVVFVNGIPLIVLACPPSRSAAGPAWQGEALAQLWHAQEAEPAARDLGVPRLFETVQLIAALDAETALYGGPGTPPHRFAAWRTPWPRTIGQVASLLGREPTAQDLLLFGMLSPPNLLDLLQNFIAFIASPETSRSERTLCLGSEYRAVQSAFLAAGKKPGPGPTGEAAGGILWHAGGDSATRQLLMMAWLVRKLRADPRQRDRPVLLFAHDQHQADALTWALRAAGLPEPARAPQAMQTPEGGRRPPRAAAGPGSARTLRSQPGSLRPKPAEPPVASAATILFTAAELQEPLGAQLAPYRASPVVLLAHVLLPPLRQLPARLRKELPDACLLGFTATPVGARDAAVAAALGPCLSACGFAESIAEQAALPVYLETRRPELHLAPEPDRTRALCLDLAAHFRRVVQPGGGQAHLIARSAETARLYKEMIDRLGSPQAVLADAPAADPAEPAGSPAGERPAGERPAGERPAAPRSRPDCAPPVPELLISCRPPASDAAATLQVVYVDAPLGGEALVQAVLAVNAPAPDKLFGLIVDYAGVCGAPPALAEFAAADVLDALCRPDEELARLQQAQKDALRCLSGVKNLYSLEQCLAALHSPEQRAQLHAAVHRCARPLELLLDDPRAQGFIPEFSWIGQVLLAAAARYRDDRIGPAACGPRVRRLLAESVARDGNELLVTRTGLASPLLDAKLAILETPEAQVDELAQAIAYEIRQHADKDPSLMAALRSELDRLLGAHRTGRLLTEPLRSALLDLRKTLTSRLDRALSRPLSATAQLLYEVLLTAAAPAAAVPAAAEPARTYGPAMEQTLAALAAQLDDQLAPLLAAARTKTAAAQELADALTQKLLAAGYSPEGARALAAQALARLALTPSQAT